MTVVPYMIKISRHILILLFFIVFSLPVCVTDIKYRRIPDWCVISGTAVLFALRLFLFKEPSARLLLYIIPGPLLLMAVRLITKGKLGIGDVKFAAFMGIFNGFPGWFVALGFASLSGLLFALAGLGTGKLNRRSRIPFAPFLTAGSIGAWFAGPFLLQKMAGYLS